MGFCRFCESDLELVWYAITLLANCFAILQLKRLMAMLDSMYAELWEQEHDWTMATSQVATKSVY